MLDKVKIKIPFHLGKEEWFPFLDITGSQKWRTRPTMNWEVRPSRTADLATTTSYEDILKEASRFSSEDKLRKRVCGGVIPDPSLSYL